jgi:hypothetical protein
MLLQFTSNKQLFELLEDQSYQQLIIAFGIDLNTVNDHLLNSKRKVDFSKITKNLEELATYLTQFENKMKSVNI